MQLEVGQIVDGEVDGIKKFGAFVKLESGQVGLVHISEISSKYVTNISDFLSQGQKVRVKVLGARDDGRLSLSIKATEQTDKKISKFSTDKVSGGRMSPKVGNRVPDFESLMKQFKKESDDRQKDWRNHNNVGLPSNFGG